MIRPVAALVLAAALLAGCASPRTAQVACQEPLQTELPIEISNGLPIVPASVDGQPVHMILDTGNPLTSLFDSVAAKLPIRPERSRFLAVSGANGVSITQPVEADTFQIGSAITKDVTLTLMHPSPLLGAISDGSIGLNVLSQFDVAVDLRAGEVLFYNNRVCRRTGPDWPGLFTEIDLEPGGLAGGHLVVAGQLNGMPADIEVDSGTALMYVTRAAALRAGVSESALADAKRFRINGIGPDAASASLVQFASVTLPGVAFRDVPGLVPEHDYAAIDVILGVPLFAFGRVWISIAGKRLYVQPY